jgi:16S rRNA (guanine966-N2)-methyltransferase
MRIIAGEKRGAKIVAPRGHDTRPTSDRAREAAFNLIGSVDGASVLDLFAGSGAYGLEALSRGASSAVFAEDDPAACEAIHRNLEKLRLTGATVLCRDAIQVLSEEAGAGRRYDLVLADPPYRLFSSVQTGLATCLEFSPTTGSQSSRLTRGRSRSCRSPSAPAGGTAPPGSRSSSFLAPLAGR